MEPIYSQDECVAAVLDFYKFLACMFMDPVFIAEPPPDGWPSITPDVMNDLGKSNEVIELLRHLPYIHQEPYANTPEGLPGCYFINWMYNAKGIATGKLFPGNELVVSEGLKYEFGGKIPAHCIGLVFGGCLMGNPEPDIILLDTWSGLVYWMNCPTKVRETASPQPSSLVQPFDGEKTETETGRMFPAMSIRSSSLSLALSPSISLPTTSVSQDDNHDEKNARMEEEEKEEEEKEQQEKEKEEKEEEEKEEGEKEKKEEEGEEKEKEEDVDDDDDDDEHEDDEDWPIEWGPCWHVKHFFEMLKNQYRDLNFMAKNAHEVFDVWTEKTGSGHPIPNDFVGTMQSIYHKYGWPDINRYRKQECLDEIEETLDKRFPGHWSYYFR